MASESHKIVHYEVQAQSRGTDSVIRLWLSTTRGSRGKKMLVGEAQTVSSEQPHIWFKVGGGDTEDGVFRNFLALLVHRGYLPKQARHRFSVDGKWEPWEPVDLAHVDGESLGMVQEHEG